MGNLSIRWSTGKTPGTALVPAPSGSSASMSFGWLFLGGMLSSRARLRFTNRGQHAVNSFCRSSIFRRTANYLLTVCLTPGGKRSIHRTLLGVGYSTKSLPAGDAPFADVMGETAIAQEFAEGRTLRSQSWKDNLASQVAGLGTRERLVAGAEKIVELTTMYQPGMVGGPIDTVVISRTTGVEWVRRKRGCTTATRH